MKKLLTVICLCLALFLALPGACSAKRSFDGDWYDSDGSLVLSIHDGYLNGCQILSTSNFVGDNLGGWTGFNCTDSLASYQEQYGLRRLPKVPTKSGFSDGTHSIGHGEYLNFDRYPYEVNLSIYYC